MKSNFPKIIYIMGSARCGSTILELLISNNADIEGLGEVTHIFRDARPDSNDVNQYIWNKVLNRCFKNKRDRLRAELLFKRISNHWAFPFTCVGMIPRKVQNEFAIANKCLFTKMAAKTNASFVVDSSKYPGRALLLARVFPGQVKVLCLTRDAGGVVDSFSKKNRKHTYQKSFIKVAVYYIYTLTCMYIVRQFLGNSELSIRYENLQENPKVTLMKIENWMKSDLSNSRQLVHIGGQLDKGLGITGNLYCKQGDVVFSKDIGNYSKVTGVQRLIIRLMDKSRSWLGF